MADFFSDPSVQLACVAFALAVLIPLAKRAAAKTETPADDAAVGFVERLLSRFRR